MEAERRKLQELRQAEREREREAEMETRRQRQRELDERAERKKETGYAVGAGEAGEGRA